MCLCVVCVPVYGVPVYMCLWHVCLGVHLRICACMCACVCLCMHLCVLCLRTCVCMWRVCMRIWVFTCVYVHACVPVYVCAPVCRVPAYTCLRVVCVYMRVWMCPCVVCASPSRTLQLACDTCLSLGVPELKVPVWICFRWKEAPFSSCSVLLSGWVPDASVGADFHSGPVYGTLCRAGRESSLSCRRSGAVFIDTCGFDILYSDAVEPFLQNRS